jgi:hypothetical protein
MIELTGAEAVKNYIKQSDRKVFEIYKENDNVANGHPVYEFEGQSAEKAAEAFAQWASIFHGQGLNYQPYKIVLSNGVDKNAADPAKARLDKRYSTMTASFVLNSQMINNNIRRDPATGDIVYLAGAPQAQPTAPAVDMSKYVAKADMEAAIAHAILNAQTEERMRQLEAENLDLYKQLRDIYEEDEDIDEEEDEEDGIGAVMKIWTPDKVKEILGVVKDGYLEIKGAHSGIQGGGEKLNAVAGPGEVEQQSEVVTIPAGAEPGTFPGYVTPTADNKDLIHKDQQIKMNQALARIYAKDLHIGDDLLIIAMIAEKKPNRFKGLIESLREE